jgi:hypothetical protein
MRRRKTKAERDHEWREAERRVWEDFRPKLAAAQNRLDALKLVAETVPPDSPGRRYYMNLHFFLHSLTPPGGSNYAEKALYIQLVQKFDEAGELKPGAKDIIERSLRHAMEEQGERYG